MFRARHEVLLVICGAINCSSQWLVSWDKHCAWTAGTEFLVWNKTATIGHVSKNELSGFLHYWCSLHNILLNYLVCLEGGLYYWERKLLSTNWEKQSAEMNWNRVLWLECAAVSVIRLYMLLNYCMYPWNACCVVEINTMCFFYLPCMLFAVCDGTCWAVPSLGLNHTKLGNPTKPVLLWWGLLLLWNRCCLDRKYSQPMYFSCAESPSSSSVQHLNAIS